MNDPIFNVAPAVSRHAKHGDDLLCFSHLRWNFVYQRPQHLMTRFARDRRVFFVEEPIDDAPEPRLDVTADAGVTVVVPHLPPQLGRVLSARLQQILLGNLLRDHQIVHPILWYYTPMALEWSRGVQAKAIVFDCMDELSAFAHAPASLLAREQELLQRADLVFTGGHSLYEAKKHKHPRVHAFPSSVDAEHFGRARARQSEPSDQASIPRPRVGFFGVIDERMDLELVAGLARSRPDWHQVLIGPVVKIDSASLPRAHNIHYLGMKGYGDLPAYLAGWDVAYLPFARNDATRFISPTKTPEYLAAGRPVVSTSIADVVRPYGERGLVTIADTPEEMASALDNALAVSDESWLRRVDDHVSNLSWDRTYAAMNRLVNEAAGTTSEPRGSREQIMTTLQLGDSDVRLLDRRGGLRG
jgi:glycosyltransferase involved in cell wall biosynthesis